MRPVSRLGSGIIADRLGQPTSGWTTRRLVDVCVIMAVLLILLALGTRVLLGPVPLDQFVAAVAAMIGLSLPALLQRAGLSSEAAATVFAVMGVIVAAATSWTQGGIDGIGAAWLPIAPLLVSIYGTDRSTAIVGIACVGAIQGLYWGQYLGIAPPPADLLPAHNLVNYLSIIALCVVVGVNHARTRTFALRRDQESRETLRVLAEESGAALIVVQDDRVRFYNGLAVDLLFTGDGEPLGRPTEDVLSASLLKDEHPEGVKFELPLVRDDQVVGWVEVQRKTIRFLGQDALLISAWDTSARRQMEADRVRSQARMAEARRLEQLGLLAGGVAHDFNNLLAAILANASMLEADALAIDQQAANAPLADESEHEQRKRGAPGVEPSSGAKPATDRRQAAGQREMVQDILVAGRQAAELVQQLLAYAGRGAAAREVVDVRQVLEEAVRIQRGAARQSGVGIELAVGAEPVMACTDPGQLGQVIANLVSNAVKASRSGQRVLLRARPATLTAEDLEHARLRHLEPGPCVLVDVADQGAGISAGNLDRIFDPFYTTRADGRGLGLAAVQGILSRLGGALLVQSDEGQGSTFSVALPLATADDLSMDSSLDAPLSSGRHGAGATVSATAATAPGTGLVAEAGSASNHVESSGRGQSGAGASAHGAGIRLPIAPGDTVATPQLNERPSTDGWVLVLDDEPLVRAQVVRVLERAGFNARAAGSVVEAVALVRERRPRLAIIDYLMPDMTGDMALARLRQLDPALPAILVSGYIKPDAGSTLAMFNDRLAKPFALGELLARVNAHIRPA